MTVPVHVVDCYSIVFAKKAMIGRLVDIVGIAV